MDLLVTDEGWDFMIECIHGVHLQSISLGEGVDRKLVFTISVTPHCFILPDEQARRMFQKRKMPTNLYAALALKGFRG